MKRFILWILSLFGLAAGALVAGYFGLALLLPNLPQTAEFPVIERQVIYNVDDAGVADLNGDGVPDRWTTNHSAAQWVSLGQGPFVKGWEVGLAQDPRWPGLEGGSGAVPNARPVRLYMEESRFVLEADGIGDAVIKASFVIPWETQTGAEGAAEARVESCGERPKCNRAVLVLRDGGRIWVEPVPAPSDGFSVTVTFAEDTDLSLIQIGSQALPVTDHRLTFASRDRHGLALADLDSDGAPELFLSRGGARGELFAIEPDARDEFFDWAEGGFTDRIDGTGITKRGCPGRQTAWGDANGDGLLDIYQVCGRAEGASDDFDNRLYIAEEGGFYSERAADFGLALSGLGSFRFFRNAGGDAPLSMLWAAPGRLALYVQGADGVFAPAWDIDRPGGNLDKIALTDLDGDGRWEALIASRSGSLFLRPDPAGADLLTLADYGLPNASEDVHFLDANADGLTDLFALPQGLFLGQPGGGFAPSGALDVGWANEGLRFAWYDADADGDLDLWLIKRDGAQFPRPVLSLYNRLPRFAQSLLEDRYGPGALRGRYWLAVLYENRLPRQGVVETRALPHLPPGTPVEVTLEAPGGPRPEWHMVGEADSARLSLTRPAITITRPDGFSIGEIRPALP